ncbi:MAG: VOC family protein [Myxococcota bacterium]
MSVRGVQLIAYVRDQASARAFYQRVLDRAPTLDVPGMTEFALGDGAVLGLMPEAGIERLIGGPVAGAGIRAELYLVVDDPAAWHARALAAGATERSALQPRDWGDDVAYSVDPDGLVLAFARRGAAPDPR